MSIQGQPQMRKKCKLGRGLVQESELKQGEKWFDTGFQSGSGLKSYMEGCPELRRVLMYEVAAWLKGSGHNQQEKDYLYDKTMMTICLCTGGPLT